LTNASSEVTPLASIATGRITSLFKDDFALRAAAMTDAVQGRRVLCIGGSGSIGSATIEQLCLFAPATLHIVDQNENSLSEVVRIYRSSSAANNIADFKALPIDYGSPVMHRFLTDGRSYDLVLNFAAIKHVRSEKDIYSILQMFDTNLLKQARLLGWLADLGFEGRYFSVSTDKAANPSSFMGATKRVMEHVIFSSETATPNATVTSARFANVAFSDGSLLKSFESRLSRGEPLATPSDTKRYFVSLQEAGQICLLASATGPGGAIIIPRLDPTHHLVELVTVARQFLARHGWEAAIYLSETEAGAAVARDRVKGRWPLLLTPLDTSGEKSFEEFVGEGERTFEIGLPNLLAVAYRPLESGKLAHAIDEIERLLTVASPLMGPTKKSLKDILGQLEPSFFFSHRETGKNLDDRR
jgi:FlaA1/EpsC-like NDP-sugar epimerase